jgi:hypothetical protein
MRHQQLQLTDSFTVIEESEIARRAPVATPAVPDLPPALGRMIVGVYAALIGVFFLTMAGTRLALFSITIGGLYICIFFAVPRILLKVENDPSRRPSFARFMREGMETGTGRTSGRAALAQIFVVPVCLVFGLLAMGLIGLWTL